jgi:hypothetical protein
VFGKKKADNSKDSGWVMGPVLVPPGNIASFRFSTAFKDGPVRGYDKHIVINLTVMSPDANGFPNTQENASLNAVERAVDNAAGRDAHLVGTTTVAGRVALRLYARTSDWLAPWEKTQRASQDQRPFEVTVTEEPDWTTYFILLPQAEQAHQDVVTFHKLDNVIVNMSEPRRIDWSLYFPDEERARAAAREIKAMHFFVRVHQMPREKRWWVEAHIVDVLTLGLLARNNPPLRAIAARHNGIYDGWGAQVSPAPELPPLTRRARAGEPGQPTEAEGPALPEQ